MKDPSDEAILAARIARAYPVRPMHPAIVVNITLGGSSARADIQRGTVLTYDQRIAYARKLWPPSGQGGVRNRHGEIGHYAMNGDTFYKWSDLRAEWVCDYTAVIEREEQEASHWACRS